MKRIACTLLAGLGLGSLAAAAEDGWTAMFNGKDLSGWKNNIATEDNPEQNATTFTVKDGELVVHGGRAHLFYTGPDGKATFKNFEFKAKVMTTPGSNSGIYFHTVFEPKGWPTKGYECQINATHSDRKKTGGLYGVADVMDKPPHADNQWFDYGIRVLDRRITITINGKVTADWTQPENWDPAKSLNNMPGRALGQGTIALQGHDPNSEVHFKDLYIRPLP